MSIKSKKLLRSEHDEWDDVSAETMNTIYEGGRGKKNDTSTNMEVSKEMRRRQVNEANTT
jgi:hypothetical protein